jgi:hypothetical protein
MGKETAKYTAAKHSVYAKHPDSPAAQTAAAKAAEEERKRLEQQAAARTTNNTPELIDADPENETGSSPSASLSGDEGLEATDSHIEKKKEPETPDLPPVEEEEKPQPEKTPDQQSNSMLRALLYSGMFMLGAATVMYIYYSTVLKSQDASSSKFTLKGASELLNKLFSKEILR